MPANRNPFFNHGVIHDISFFFGRSEELRTLYEAIVKHQSVSLVGPGHIGKSSLLNFLGRPELQKDYASSLQKHLFILTDWREYLQKNREDFFNQVCDQICWQCRSVLILHPAMLPGEDKFRKLLQEIQLNDFHPVLLMDAFDRVTSNPAFSAEFFSFLRSLAGVNDLITYVTATKKPLHEVCHSPSVSGSPFFNIFLTCSLGPLTLPEARSMIEEPACSVYQPFGAEDVSWLLKMAGRHPFFLQIACHHLFEARSHEEDRSFHRGHIRRALYQELTPHFLQAWEDLDEGQKSHLKQEIFQPADYLAQFPELSESLLFRRMIYDLFQGALGELTEEDLRDALDHLNNPDLLAKSKLGELQYISLQIRNDASPSNSKRGILVREMLKKALDLMKADNIRSDAAPEWRLYNILWYHYFKYNLPNNLTAARLNLSPRQFYREQERALQMLLREVQDLEQEALNSLFS